MADQNLDYAPQENQDLKKEIQPLSPVAKMTRNQLAKQTRKKEQMMMMNTLGLKKIERRLWDKVYVDWTPEEKAKHSAFPWHISQKKAKDEQLDLQGHREALASNPEAMTYNYRKEVFGGFHGGSPVRTRMIDKIMEATSYSLKGREGSSTRQEHEQKRAVCENMVDALWDAHGHQPLFNFTMDGLPMAWNDHWWRPLWDCDYSKVLIYEIGHWMDTRNSVGVNDHPNNLSFQSARCNKHIQSSLSFKHLKAYFEGKSTLVVRERIDRIEALYQTAQWKEWLVSLGFDTEYKKKENQIKLITKTPQINFLHQG